MKKSLQLLYSTACFVLIILATAAIGLASQHEDNKTTSGEVKQETAEAYHAIVDYSVDQRDEAINAARAQLDKLDAKIDTMQNRLDERWHKMTRAAQQKQQAALKTLRAKRNDVAEWYGGLRHSSADAWDKVKMGFSDSYSRLEKAFDSARKEFGDNHEMKDKRQ